MRIIAVCAIATSLFAATSAFAQQRDDQDSAAEEWTTSPVVTSPPRTSKTTETASDMVGRRQSREQISQSARIEPMARIDSRIQNRVQSRLRNRIDRYYDPQANATSPFSSAAERARNARLRPRR